MYYYKIYGLNIESDYKLEEAVSVVKTDNPDITITLDSQHDVIYDMTEKDKEIDGYLYRYESDRGWVRYPGQGAFIIRKGESITYRLYDGYDHLLVNEIFLCLILPIAIFQKSEQLMLHGSGLVLNDKCFVVSGRSGAGKSTVTNALIDCGAKFLADDTVALTLEDDIYANSAYPQQKLCLDQITDEMKNSCEMVLLPEDDGVVKYAVRDRERFFEGRKKLDALIVLSPSDQVAEPILEEMNGAEKLTMFLENLYKPDVYKLLGMAPDVFKKCMNVASKIKVYKLSRPLEGMTTKEQVELIRTKL